MPPDGVQAFINLFRGRGDCYGSWDGGCIRKPLTRKEFEAHLSTGPYIGVYPNLGDMCSWGCVDIDGKDHDHNWEEMTSIGRNLQTVLAVKDVKAWLERTRNGIHVWVFPDIPLIPAADMRRCLQAACKVVGYSPKEINPKQESLPKGKVGNYVRLPYPGGENATERTFIDGLGVEYTLDDTFMYIDKHGRSSNLAIAAVAALMPPPAPTHGLGSVDATAGLDVEDILPLLSGKAFVIWRDGPLEGADRSTTLTHLSHLLVEQLEPGAALAVLNSADLRWGKFNAKGDPERLVQMIERAVAKKEESF